MMKKLLFILTAMFISIWAIGQNAWINEIHYDNLSGDVNEFVEVIIENPGNYTLSDFEVYKYNGNNGAVYGNDDLSSFIAGVTNGNFTIYYLIFPANVIQNGSPDGLALTYQGVVISGQFLSYEGELTASDGPAFGMTSIDIGVSEPGDSPVGESLQLSGTGEIYDDFTWQEPAAETPGALNNGQTLGAFVPDPEPTNYPTDFTATVDVNDIDVTWTNDEAGPQLPSGYLVLAKYEWADDFTLPVDGVPVENDWNFTDDGYYANNIFGDNEENLFMFLDVNMGYDFAIFPYTNSGEFIDYKTDGAYPTAFGLTDNVYFSFEEYFNDISNRSGMTYYSVIGDDQSWNEIDWNGNPPGAMRMNGYSGGTQDNEDWAITQQVTATSYSNLYIRFDQYTNFGDPPNGLSLWVSTDYTGGDPSANGTWEEITDRIEFPTSNSTYTTSGSADVSDYISARTYFALKYESNGSIAAVDWRIDNIQVYSYVPTIEVTYPNGGETLYQGQQVDITWDHEFWVEETVALYLQ